MKKPAQHVSSIISLFRDGLTSGNVGQFAAFLPDMNTHICGLLGVQVAAQKKLFLEVYMWVEKHVRGLWTCRGQRNRALMYRIDIGSAVFHWD